MGGVCQDLTGAAYENCYDVECATEIGHYYDCALANGCVEPETTAEVTAEQTTEEMTDAPEQTTTEQVTDNPTAEPTAQPTHPVTSEPSSAPSVSPTETPAVPTVALGYTQTFTGIATDECEAAIPFIRQTTASITEVAEENVHVTPGPECGTNERRRLSESSDEVTFLISIHVTEEEKAVATEKLQEDTFQQDFETVFAEEIQGTEFEATFADVVSAEVSEIVEEIIVVVTTTETVSTTKIADEEEASSAGAAIGGAVAAVFVFAIAFVIWYFGYWEVIKQYLCGGKDDDEFLDIGQNQDISDDGAKDKVEILSASNINEQNNKYVKDDEENPSNEIDPERAMHLSPKKVPANKGRVIL